jgi:DNA repair exonuclease SbcCD nuclease subunit
MRILHTSDLQLGMTRWFFDADAQARYLDDQFATIGRLSDLTTERAVDAVVIAGDIFENVVPDRRIVARAAEALKAFEVPVYLLAGNHDPRSPESVWSNDSLISKLGSTIHLLDAESTHVLCNGALEIVGAPWTSRKPDRDLVSERLADLEPKNSGVTRVLVGHGVVEGMNPDRSNRNEISLSRIERAIAEGVVDYVALGDHHSSHSVGVTGRVWYSGAPQMTSFREIFASTNRALVVDFGSIVDVSAVIVGDWEFERPTIAASGRDLIDAITRVLERGDNRLRRAIRFVLEGTVNLAEQSEIDRLLDEARDLYASADISQNSGNLSVVANDEDLEKLTLGGYGDAAVGELVKLSRQSGDDGEDAILALRTLYRLLTVTA